MIDDTFRPGERLTLGVAARLSRYLQVLTQARKIGRESISSQEVSEYTNVNATQIRRDLSGFGKFGKRGVGYNVEFLIGEIRKILRTQGQHNIALVGAGRLGQAIASSGVFADHGFHIAAVFDRDSEKVGMDLGSLRVQGMDELSGAVRQKNVIVGVLAVPGESAQEAADALVDAGVKILFNYSNALIDSPSDVVAHHSTPLADLLPSVYFLAAS
jgi:redox-sensing transcriptional repressor